MIRAYLLLNALIYFVFSVWCTIAPDKTARNIGFDFRSGSGRSEYLTVYGGLQLGMALFFLIAGLRSDYQTGGLVFALCLYSAIIAFRLFTFATVAGIEQLTFIVAGLELLLGAAAAILWWRDNRS